MEIEMSEKSSTEPKKVARCGQFERETGSAQQDTHHKEIKRA